MKRTSKLLYQIPSLTLMMMSMWIEKTSNLSFDQTKRPSSFEDELSNLSLCPLPSTNRNYRLINQEMWDED